jgi:hypothetical protein
VLAVSGSFLAARTIMAIPIGTLMRKIERQPNWVTRPPPMTGPRTVALAITAP